MHPENGWFQLESQRPVNARPDNRRPASGHAAAPPKPLKPDNTTNTQSFSHTYEPKPTANDDANVHTAPMVSPPMANSAPMTVSPAPKEMPEPNTPVPCDEHQQRIMPEEASEPNKPVPYAEYQQRTMPNTYGEEASEPNTPAPYAGYQQRTMPNTYGEEASEPNTPAPYAGYQQRTMPNTYGKEASEPNKPVPYAGYQQRTMPNAYEEEASEPNKPVPYAGYQQRAMPNTYRKEAAPYRKNSDAMQWASFNWADEMALQNRHAQTVGSRGPVLEQDSILHEALQIFINKKIPERPVHTKGFGAFGFFQTVNSMREFTTLPFLQSPGQQVPVMVRFSFAVSTKGTPDTSRNVRGFSTKFYAREGVFDLLCNHIPVLFVRDGIRFPEAITSLMPSPTNNLPDPEQFWAFVSRAPEAIHFVMWLYSDVGTVKSFRHIQGHSVNTYVWRNARGVRRYVKYHWLPVAGEETIDREEAAALAGEDPDIAGRDLFDTIASGRNVQYELYVQLMDPEDEACLPYDPLDCTKVWDEREYPLIPVGCLTLNRNPDNYLEQVEKAAFSPTNLLEGAELSDDKLLQARANIYWDSQRRRLGEDFRSIPVNDQADWIPDYLVSSGAGTYAEGELVRMSIPDPDDFTQAGEHYMSLSPEEQDHLVDNLAADLALVSPRVCDIVLAYLSAASEELADRVWKQIAVYMNQ